jgi:hypothetical protein
MGSESKKVYVIISGDVDYSEHHEHDEKMVIFDKVARAAADLNVRLSFYFTAKEAAQVADSVRLLAAHGHEIGCHGLIHNDDEEYSRLSYEAQRRYIGEATSILSATIGAKIDSFRAPRVKVSSQTYQVIEELGYVTDSSVCSQRMDLISSNMFNKDWLFAPRLPYHPSAQNPFRRGKRSILVVPISALLVPFISSVLYVFGLSFMQVLFRTLYAESLATGKPIVYLYHPYEFIREIPGKKQYHANVSVHGLRFRRYLYRGTPQDKFRQHIALLEYMKSFAAVKIVTMKQFYDLTSAVGY